MTADQPQDDWLEEAARALGVLPLSPDEATALLDLARDVAHNTERRYAPLTCFLVGLAAAGDRDGTAGLAADLAAAARAG